MYNNTQLHPELYSSLKNINECLIKIVITDNLNIKLKKLESLKDDNFYDQYPDKIFED